VNENTLTTAHLNTLQSAQAFTQLVEMIAPDDPAVPGMVAPSSARVYRNTFAAWLRYAQSAGIDPLDLNFSTVRDFLTVTPGSRSTQQRRLSALRKLAEVAAIADPGNPFRRAAYDSLRLFKSKYAATGAGHERQRRALSPAEADRLLREAQRRVIEAEDHARAKAKRDYAIVATLLLTGLRRAELAALRWHNIDFANGVITVRHGKGDKAREAAIYSQAALEALKAWQLEQPPGYSHVVVRVRRGGVFTEDRPVDTTTIWRVVANLAKAAGLGHLKPHDLRRTLATELLATGDPVHHVQAQLGHENASTTLDNYAVSVDARQRRKAGRVRYG